MIVRRIFAIAGATLLVVALTTAAALAWPGGLEGQPDIGKDCPAGYYLWHDEGGMHLRTHGPGDEHLFTARLRTDGIFVNVDAVRLENRDNFAVLDGGHTLVLKFRTYDFTDGGHFNIRGGTRLRLNLQLDQELISTDNIFLGAEGKHPETNPFTIRR